MPGNTLWANEVRNQWDILGGYRIYHFVGEFDQQVVKRVARLLPRAHADRLDLRDGVHEGCTFLLDCLRALEQGHARLDLRPRHCMRNLQTRCPSQLSKGRQKHSVIENCGE